ncbi:tetratricopeptide repeat protein [Myxococcota bacterium]|nr:tetratricopeptide repeat protein [Myxococcota bacterium]
MKTRDLFILALLLIAIPAFAQKNQNDKDELATAESAAKNVIKPKEDAEALRQVEDSKTEQKIAEKEEQLSKVRQDQIRKMRKIIKDKPLYKKRADLLFRIAEREWDEAKYRYFLARKEYDKQMEQLHSGLLKKEPVEPKPDYSLAITEYKKLLKEFPNYPRLDEVIFYLGRGLHAADQKKQGASYMLRLTKQYPKSKYVSRAYLAVAEYYFDIDLLLAAKTNYLKVLEDKQSGEYAYALYKLGYVYFNMGTPEDYESAIKSFQEVVALQKKGGKVYFTKQAYGALSMTYAELCEPADQPNCERNGWKRARDYFRAEGGAALEVERLEAIAANYGGQDQTAAEIAVYEYLVARDKENAKLPVYAKKLLEAHKKSEDMKKIDEVFNRFYADLGPKTSWYIANKDKKDNESAMGLAKQFREDELDWIISKYHSKAQEVEKLKDDVRANELYTKAAEYYERYLIDFPEAKMDRLYEMQFYLAEIYFFQFKKWDKAMEHYRGVVARDPKGKYSKDSAYSVILASEEKMADAGIIERPKRVSKKDAKSKKGKGKAKEAEITYTAKKDDKEFKPIPKTPLRNEEEGFLQACKEYVEHYPKDSEVPFVSFRSAEIFINKGHYGEGINRLEVIMEHHPKHKYAGHAAATLFDANYRLRRWHEMERWGRYMLDRKNYAVMTQKQLHDVIAISINEYAQELSEKGQKDKAAEEMMRFVNEFPKHEKAPIALFNAAVINEQAEKTEEAILLYERLIGSYQKAPQATEAHFVLGALYESQTEFETAAQYFEKMASFPDVPQMADALYNAGAIRAALEQFNKAEDIFTTYVKKFPERDDIPEIYMQLAQFQEKQQHWSDALKTYDAYKKAYGKTRPDTIIEIYLSKALVHQKMGSRNARKLALAEVNAALNAFNKLPDEAKANPKVRQAAARCLFMKGNYIFEDFEAVEVKFPMHVLRKSIVKKAELLNNSEKIFFQVLEFKSHEVNAAALYRIGQGYYLFAKSLFDLPTPEELSEDEKIIYRAELDDKAAPLHEKSIEALRNALRLAHENHVYNEWSQRSAELLVKLSPEAFPIINDAVVNSEWPVSATFSTTFIADPDGELAQMIKAKPATKPASGPAAPATASPAAASPAAKPAAQPAAKPAKEGKK